jgi:flagellar L-ring protein precursor FlgH
VKTLCAVLVLAQVVGCVAHLEPYAPRRRDWKKVNTKVSDKSAPAPSAGSLFTDDGDDLFSYRRATRPGDIVTVVVSEQTLADGTANTKLSRQSTAAAQITSLLGLMQQIAAKDARISPGALVGATTKTSFNGAGATDRSASLSATIPAVVVGRQANGLLRIEGHRVFLVNNEEHHFYISGLVRRDDIDDRNELASDRIAEAEVEFTGRGAVTNQNRQGWLARVLDVVWPF